MTDTITPTERLVARFPLNGDESMLTGGYDIMIRETLPTGETVGFVVYDRGYVPARAVQVTDLSDALALCLSNNGFGQFRIKDVTS